MRSHTEWDSAAVGPLAAAPQAAGLAGLSPSALAGSAGGPPPRAPGRGQTARAGAAPLAAGEWGRAPPRREHRGGAKRRARAIRRMGHTRGRRWRAYVFIGC